MATLADKLTDIQKVVDVYDTARSWGVATLLGKIDAVRAQLSDKEAKDALVQVEALRSSFASALETGEKAAIKAHVNGIKTILDTEFEPGTLDFERALYAAMATGALSIQTRGITFATISASGNTGTGTLKRLTVNEQGQDIERLFLDGFSIECVKAFDNGAGFNNESFFPYSAKGADYFDERGPGSGPIFKAQGKADTLIKNGSFHQRSGTDVLPTGVTNWDFSNHTFGIDAKLVTDDLAFKVAEERTSEVSASNPTGVGRALWLDGQSGSASFQQRLKDVNTALNRNKPVLPFIWYRRDSAHAGFSAGSGDLAIDLGGINATVALSAQTGWNLLIPTIDETLYFNNYNDGDPIFKVTWDPSAGDVLLDNAGLVYFEEWNGTWWVILPGGTRFVVGDKFTGTDALAGSEGKIQAALFRAFEGKLQLRHAGSPSQADP